MVAQAVPTEGDEGTYHLCGVDGDFFVAVPQWETTNDWLDGGGAFLVVVVEVPEASGLGCVRGAVQGVDAPVAVEGYVFREVGGDVLERGSC